MAVELERTNLAARLERVNAELASALAESEQMQGEVAELQASPPHPPPPRTHPTHTPTHRVSKPQPIT